MDNKKLIKIGEYALFVIGICLFAASFFVKSHSFLFNQFFIIGCLAVGLVLGFVASKM